MEQLLCAGAHTSSPPPIISGAVAAAPRPTPPPLPPSQVEQLLQRRGWTCGSVHGDISQPQRTAAVGAFKDGSIPILIATDVAARGLDIPDVEVGMKTGCFKAGPHWGPTLI